MLQPLGTSPRGHGQPPQAAQAWGANHANQPGAAPVAPVATSAPSLLDKPANPAKVDLTTDHLAIRADNSSLSEILHQVTAASGMTVEGLGQDQRIFGSYGPGEPYEVLSALLHGSGYNVVMLGQTATGAPRQLVLSPRSASISNNAPSRPAQTEQDEEDDEVQAQPAQPTPETPPAPAPGQSPQGGVRTPQQMLQELQQMRQLQQQQQQQQQQQAPPQ
ncbi:MAG TPA: hypothetical protein VHT28_12220 [Silvibacterium sp.]|nr:hypothetical protein [Silvibacterium sp.]